MAITSDYIVVTEGSVFAVSSKSGDIHQRTVEGFYAHDTRFLSSLRMTLEGREPEAVASDQLGHPLASFYSASRRSRQMPAASISIVRDRFVGEGLHEDISVTNHSPQTRSLRLEFTFDADFADVFEVRRGPVRKVGSVSIETRPDQHLALAYRRDDYRRETWIAFSTPPVMRGKTATFELQLEPKEIWTTCLTVLPVIDTPPPALPCAETMLGAPFGAYERQKQIPLDALKPDDDQRPLQDRLPRLGTNYLALEQVYKQAVADLQSLQMEHLPGHYILAAGLPWFMAVFGRDSIIAAIQAKLLGPDLMLGTLHTLANLQATTTDRFQESDPGKIPHEVRAGELSIFKQVPHSRYYGTIDATPLFVRLLWEAYEWTGSDELLKHMLPAVEAAIHWIDRYGDIDGDGFLEYKRRTRAGLRNQGWKDSHDSISFQDGTLAEGPIALAEVQGYAYDAKRRMAQIYRILKHPAKARLMEKQAQELKKSFNEAFWMPDEGFFALALDGEKRQVNSISSNPGHCLWSGIVDEDKAPAVIGRLMAPEMFSGWGIRTLSTEMVRYNPLSYHNGSVWPHDTSLIAAGMVAYGFIDEAREVALAMVDAASAFPDNRLPELFAGYPRRDHSFPVPYPDANSPQAWACGAIIYLLETLLGVVPAGDRLLHEAGRGQISLTMAGVPYRGSQWLL